MIESCLTVKSLWIDILLDFVNWSRESWRSKVPKFNVRIHLRPPIEKISANVGVVVSSSVLDLPGIVQGAAQGRGRGRQVVAVAHTADLIVMMLDITK